MKGHIASWREGRRQAGPWRCDCPTCDYSASSRFYLIALLKVYLHVLHRAGWRW